MSKKLDIDAIYDIFEKYHEMSVKYIREYEKELYRLGDKDKEKLYTNRAKSNAIEECIEVLKEVLKKYSK